MSTFGQEQSFGNSRQPDELRGVDAIAGAA